jgi:HEAT repeat protein
VSEEIGIPDSSVLIVLSIRRSSAKRIEGLVADLSSVDPITRESAIARLTLIGPRAVERLVSATQCPTSAATARVAALRTLEAIDDPRALDAALGGIDDSDSTVAIAAIRVARRHLHGHRSAETVDRLTALAIARTRPETLRVEALRALGDLNRKTIAPLLKSLDSDPSPAVRAEAEAARGRRRARARDPGELLAHAAERGLPENSEPLHRALVLAGTDVAPIVLLRIIERLREREAAAPLTARAGWSALRAAAHVALANRASRLALYDIRESLETANDAVPVEFLTALRLIGDASCLNAMATAFSRSRDAWFRERLVDVFRTVVKRERLTRRHAVMKKIQKRWPGTFDLLVG